MKMSEVLKSLEEGKVVCKVYGSHIGTNKCYKMVKINEVSVIATWWADRPQDMCFDLSHLILDLEGKYEVA